MSAQVPMLLLNRVDFKTVTSIHSMQWRCADISPVTRMPPDFLMLRKTFLDESNNKTLAYKVHGLNRSGKDHGVELNAIRALSKKYFQNIQYSSVVLHPSYFIMPYHLLLENHDTDRLINSSQTTEHFYLLETFNDSINIFLPKVVVETIHSSTGAEQTRDRSILSTVMNLKIGTTEVDEMLSEFDVAYKQWRHERL